VGSKGVAAVHLAAGKETEKNTRCLKMLLPIWSGPQYQVWSSDGLTPLHIAALWGCYQNLKLLLMNGGNPNIKHNVSQRGTILYGLALHADGHGEGRKRKPDAPDGAKRGRKDEDLLVPETQGMTDKELRLRLLELGESPGPISCRTRPHLYAKAVSPYLGYSPELCRALRTFELPDCQVDEQKWREGIIKSSFNYLLLDPRLLSTLYFMWVKGKRSRPYSHLYENLCPKVQHILQVWNAGQGVISLHCFQNVIPVEAYTREACMVEAIGLKMLTNRKRGDFYGVVSNWQVKKKRDLGVHLLYRLRPADIRQK
uniref:LEM domain-containing protein n=1 Tax=Cyclopterus lumpus TaxID=8103 RepID=A0A8C2ZY69_CYCLU